MLKHRVRLATRAAKTLQRRVQTTFFRFLKAEATSGILLILATGLAMVLANSRFSLHFTEFWHQHLTLRIGRLALQLSLHEWLNDGLMALFFLVVGLEIKRELVQGELASLKRAALPVLAALGGMVAPGLVYYLQNRGLPTASGWAIPTATDIAFTVGVMTLLGRRVPLWVKVFVTALAIADDLGAVVVIAVFYTGKLALYPSLVAAGLTLVLLLLNRFGVRRLTIYLGVGVLLWLAMLKSGLHPTLTGVILGMCVPIGTRRSPADFISAAEHAIAAYQHADATSATTPAPAETAQEQAEQGDREETALAAVLDAIEGLKSPLHRLEHALHHWVALGILPLFALANAGVVLPSLTQLREILLQPVTRGVFFGLLVGKPLGIFVASVLAVKLRIGELPVQGRLSQLLGAAMLAGIGFTMSIFITGLAFTDPQQIMEAKLGIIGGSLASALLGAVVLRLLGAPRPKRPERPSSDATKTDSDAETQAATAAEPASAAETA